MNGLRSRKSQEVMAKQIVKVSTSLFIAFWVSILIFPITAIIGSVIKGQFFEVTPWNSETVYFYLGHMVFFLILELLLYKFTLYYQKRALDLYDELYPD